MQKFVSLLLFNRQTHASWVADVYARGFSFDPKRGKIEVFTPEFFLEHYKARCATKTFIGYILCVNGTNAGCLLGSGYEDEKNILPDIGAEKALAKGLKAHTENVPKEKIFWIDIIVIDPAVQRQGYGRLLLSQTEKKTAKKGYTHILLFTNMSLTPYYQKLGYTTLPESAFIHTAFKSKEIFMLKKIG